VAQPKNHILKEYANGVMDDSGKFYPYKMAEGAIAAKYGIRFYIKSVSAFAYNTGDKAAISFALTGLIKNVSTAFVYGTCPATTAALNNTLLVTIIRDDIDILLDVNTAVTQVGSPTLIQYSVTYAEIDETPGVYST
jgi:hypothetical protein